MELIKTLISSWPLVALILGVVALFLFRKALTLFLVRADEVGVAGVKVTARTQEQRQINAAPQISKAEELAKPFQSPLLLEVEENIRKNLDVFSKDRIEREKALIKVLATNQIAVDFERTYRLIFGSQLAVLHALGSSSSVLEDPEMLRPYYEQAKSKYSDFYGSYGFENWLGFLKGSFLITEQQDKVGITVRGKEFLKYLIDQGYSIKKGG